MKRNISIDILKGIGILLVLTTHSIGGILEHVAYTFHMPLFFIVSGLFFSKQSVAVLLKKDFTRLIIPVLLTIGIIVAISLLKFLYPDSYLTDIKDLLWNSTPSKIGGYLQIPGNMWFLFALFFSRFFFNVLCKLLSQRLLPVGCLFLGFSAYVLGQVLELPLCILQGMSVLPYVYLGYYLKLHGGIETGIPTWFWLSILLWIVYVFYGDLHVDQIVYKWCYFPEIITAAGGVYFVYLVSKYIAEKTSRLSIVLAFLGTYSLILICVPGVETYCFPMQTIIPEIPFRTLWVLLGKVIWCAFAFWACLRIPFLKSILGNKN